MALNIVTLTVYTVLWLSLVAKGPLFIGHDMLWVISMVVCLLFLLMSTTLYIRRQFLLSKLTIAVLSTLLLVLTTIVHFWHGGILNLLYLYTIPFFVVGLFTIGLVKFDRQ